VYVLLKIKTQKLLSQTLSLLSSSISSICKANLSKHDTVDEALGAENPPEFK
jgi:hypothetical protein